MPKLTVILDLDGVLITTPPWKPDVLHQDGYSAFNQNCIDCFNLLMDGLDAEVWLISTRRKGKSLPEFHSIFTSRGILAPLKGLVPVYEESISRKDEVLRFVRDNALQHYLIIDDNTILNQLPREMKRRLVLTQYLLGFDEEKLAVARIILAEK